VSMNRQTKRYLQRQGQLGADGTPETAQRRPPAARAPTRPDPSKGNRLQRTQQFVHEVNVELRKVAWPTRAETINYSSVVLITLVVLILLIFLLDTGFAKSSLFLFK
jgi:preprotein translocase subunit SecE